LNKQDKPIKCITEKYNIMSLWVSISGELPTCEVLARNERNDVLIGFLSFGNYASQGSVYCDDGTTELNKVTHYIAVVDLLKI
jgi:hypothetical protein